VVWFTKGVKATDNSMSTMRGEDGTSDGHGNTWHHTVEPGAGAGECISQLVPRMRHQASLPHIGGVGASRLPGSNL
jgi:hypothetical protein